MRCRLCDSNRLLSVLDLGATPPCESFLGADELDSPEATFPLHLRLCEDCLLLQIPALITPEDNIHRVRVLLLVLRQLGSSTPRRSSMTPRIALDSAPSRSWWKSRAMTVTCYSTRSLRAYRAWASSRRSTSGRPRASVASRPKRPSLTSNWPRRSVPSMDRRTWSSPTMSMPTSLICWASPGRYAGCWPTTAG